MNGLYLVQADKLEECCYADNHYFHAFLAIHQMRIKVIKTYIRNVLTEDFKNI